MANQGHGEIGVPEYGLANQTHGVGIHCMPAAANFFDEGGSAYLGELEEAFMQGAVARRSESGKKTFLSATPTTLEIFSSWAMRMQHPGVGNSQSAASTDSGSALNGASVSLQPQSESSLSLGVRKASTTQIHRHDQEERASEGSKASGEITAGHGAQERRRGVALSPENTLDPKTLRRLAQNREAARKSRLRKKAYVQQLESCRIRLTQLEQDLQRASSQGLFIGESGAGNPLGNSTTGAAFFNVEYGRWLEEKHVHMAELREGLHSQLPDGDLRATVDNCLAHYDKIFRVRAAAASVDVFHLITGMWTTPVERCFMWMGGFRPSEILKILIEQLDPLTGQQLMGMRGLQQSAQQAEEALSHGLEQLQRSLADTVASPTSTSPDTTSYDMDQMAIALAKLSNLEVLVIQADNLRQQTLHHLHRILTIRQTARCFLVIGEFHDRLRAVSWLWASRPRGNQVAEDGMCNTTSDMQTTFESMPNHFSTF